MLAELLFTLVQFRWLPGLTGVARVGAPEERPNSGISPRQLKDSLRRQLRTGEGARNYITPSSEKKKEKNAKGLIN
jgi:hypothetical protein